MVPSHRRRHLWRKTC